jgi:ferric-dicitrate binding protein FerR (iron transport regulator)
MNREMMQSIERAVDGRLSAAEWEALQGAVVADAEVRREYVRRMSLQADMKALPKLPELVKTRSLLPAVLWSSAAAVALTLLVGGLITKRPEVAVLVEADRCQWAGSDLPTTSGSKLTTGTLALVQGMATLRFSSGATVTIEAPTKIELRDKMQCRLIEGSLVADVPESAHGFTVLTPDLKVVDLGTKFGLTTAAAAGNSQVKVFQGEIKVGRHGGEMELLTEGKAKNWATAGEALDQEVPRADAVIQESGGWRAVSTSFGRGKDTFVRRGDGQGPYGASPLLMVKHTELPKGQSNERRAYLTFDLAELNAGGAKEAKLVLSPEPSGLGFSALVPDSQFAVHVMEDGAWDEATLAWSESFEGKKVAEFTIPRGGVMGRIQISSEALTRAVQEAHGGLLTLVITRETGESDTSGLVHAFASKEHPTSQPPTLRIR